MITNQTSVSKGLFSFSQMIKMNNIVLKRVNDLLKQEVFNEIVRIQREIEPMYGY